MTRAGRNPRDPACGVFSVLAHLAYGKNGPGREHDTL